MPQTSTPLPQLIYPRVTHLQKRLSETIYTAEESTPRTSVGPATDSHLALSEGRAGPFESIRIGDVFSPSKKGEHGEFPWTHRWFKIEIGHPPPSSVGEGGIRKAGNRYLRFEAHGEFTAYWNGAPWCGLDPCHPRCPLPPPASEDGAEGPSSSPSVLYLEGGQWQTGFWFGLKPPDEHGFRLLRCSVETRDDAAFEAYHDLSMLVEWIEQKYEEEGLELKTQNGYYEPLTDVDPDLRRMLKRLNDACDAYDRGGLEPLAVKLKAIYADFLAHPNAMTMSYVGHAHMDLVWLWPEKVTYRKIVHTYSTVLRLMERYPELTFTMSQPPLYYHVAECELSQADAIRGRMEEGRWEFTGVLEVEADTQIPCGEGLARSFIYGQERIQSVRGSESRTVWIPDVFGYSQCLPQLMALAGISNFYTTKILWSTVTKFPHNSFLWKSPDGSEVLAHLGVAGYSCHVKYAEAVKASRLYRQADVHDEILCAAGFGDGGGGPTEDHCERARRLKNLTGAPKSRWSTVDSFFDRLGEKKRELPVYRGELFLEYHRAVHTTQSDFKAGLRGCERALQTREAMRVLAKGKELGAEAWLRVLFMHFHDAIPGSSIHTVYDELNDELKAIEAQQKAKAGEEWPRGSELVVINPLAWRRWCTLELPSANIGDYFSLHDPDGTAYPLQHVGNKGVVSVLVDGISAPSFVFSPVKVVLLAEHPTIKASPSVLDNGILRAEFSAAGQLSSLTVDEIPLDIEEPGRFTIHDDNPTAYDAWDMDHHIIWMKRSLTSSLNLKVVATGPVVSILEGECPVGESSSMTIRYILESDSESLKVECDISWNETNKALRYEIQTGYRGEYARFGGPFGSVDRSQTECRELEEAQWEVPGSRWASILDGTNNGLSIVAEAKYGFRAKDGCLGVTLLRSPTYPDPVADRGLHKVRFALSAHRDVWGATGRSNTAAKADELFTPGLVLENSLSVPAGPIVFTELGSVVPSWVMPCRRDEGFLVRMHEVAGGRSHVRFTLAREGAPMFVQVVNLNEDVIEVLEAKAEGGYSVVVGAHKIVTIKVVRNCDESRKRKVCEDEQGAS